MADISDVEQCLADAIASILYPEGTTQSSIVGVLCRIYRGWPSSASLNADLAAGAVNVTVCAENDSGRATTRYLLKWEIETTESTMSASVDGETITFAGVPTSGDVVGAIIDGVPYSYRVQSGDSLSVTAASLALAIQSVRPALNSGFTVTIAGASSVKVRVVHDSTASCESRRQEKDLRIICWCPTPVIRDTVAAAIDAAIEQIAFLSLTEGSKARITYRNTSSYDQAQNALLYRRDLLYTVEYPTITTAQQPSMLFGASGLNGNVTFA